MKYSELPERQAKALVDLYLRIADSVNQEQRAYNITIFQLLLAGNGAGVLILANTLAKLYESKTARGDLVLPFMTFLVGVLFAGLAYLPVASVSTGAARHIGESLEKLIKDVISLEELQTWGHTKFTACLLWLFIGVSFVCFIGGMVLVVRAIR
ncbi:MAG TPA: hypothetical protein PLK30_28410 [Blastocatellia bacterium]|nr:hypothetical protein [Blastocatellia bacterium]